jgi:anti-sigma regulatory factor (Ser/Thr protein kinase)
MSVLAEIELPASLDNLARLMEAVTACAGEFGVDSARVMQLELCLEEALVNVINYAYDGAEGTVRVVCAEADNDRFSIEISDSGKPFDPLARATPDTEAGIDERNIGGLGIHLIRELMDDVTYRRDGDRNVLTMVMSKL